MEETVCGYCTEPIWSFVCSPCMTKEIEGWLPDTFRTEFRTFSRSFARAAPRNSGLEHCMKCTRLVEAPICLTCFLTEVQHWLQPRDADLANSVVHLGGFEHSDPIGNPRTRRISSLRLARPTVPHAGELRDPWTGAARGFERFKHDLKSE